MMGGMLSKVVKCVSLSVLVYASPLIPDDTTLLTLTVVALGYYFQSSARAAAHLSHQSLHFSLSP